MAVNSDEAERAKELGREALRNQDYNRAIKYFEISCRLHPNEDTRQLLNTAKAGAARRSGPPPPRPDSTPHPSGGPGGHGLAGVAWQGLDRFLEGLASHTPPQVLRACERYIHPSFRRPLAVVGLLIIILFIYRVVLGGPRMTLGHLPGDIYYSSQTTYVSMPIMTSLLFSGLLSAIQRLMRPTANNR